MVKPLLAALALACLTACSPPAPRPDAGVDTSCGFDCAAQEHYGLILNRCFEYASSRFSPDTPPALGLWVKPQLFELEGGIKTIEVDYRQGGQSVQTDFFTIQNGDLLLVRRSAGPRSVTYRTGTAITGVKWLTRTTGVGETIPSSSSAFRAPENMATDVSYRVTTQAPGVDEKRTPLATYDTAVTMLFGETPDNGSDSRRVFVPGVGFTLLASPFNLLGGSPTPVYLQRIRDLGTPDAGPEGCSLGVP